VHWSHPRFQSKCRAKTKVSDLLGAISCQPPPEIIQYLFITFSLFADIYSNLESYNVLHSCIGYSQLNSDDKQFSASKECHQFSDLYHWPRLITQLWIKTIFFLGGSLFDFTLVPNFQFQREIDEHCSPFLADAILMRWNLLPWSMDARNGLVKPVYQWIGLSAMFTRWAPHIYVVRCNWMTLLIRRVVCTDKQRSSVRVSWILVHKVEKARVTEKPSLHMMRTVHTQRAWKEERIQNQV